MSEAASQALTPPGYERLTKKPETKSLRLTADKPIELTLRNGHVFRLRRGDDGVVRISMNNFQLPDPETDVLSDEVKLPANASVDIRRNPALADNKINLKKTGNYDEFLERRVNDYHIYLPNRAVNLLGQQIDFMDIGDEPFSGLSILMVGRRAGDNMIFITNHDGGFGIAAPGRQ